MCDQRAACSAAYLQAWPGAVATGRSVECSGLHHESHHRPLLLLLLLLLLLSSANSAAKSLAGNYGFDPLYLAAKDDESLRW
jgi:hypothetical protein